MLMPLRASLHPIELRLHLQWRLQTRVTKGHYQHPATTSTTTTSTTLHPIPHLTTSHQPSQNNYTSRSTRRLKHHFSTTTLTMFNSSLHSRLKSTNYSHYNSRHHSANSTATDHYSAPRVARLRLSTTQHMAEACNVDYYHTTSFHTIRQLRCCQATD